MALPRTPQPHDPLARLLGTSPAMVALRTQLQHLARFDAIGQAAVPTLLLQGETGTGKSLVARVVHDSGPRAAGPFVEVNCATLPETMLEAELFGFEAGAFTDAKRAKPGLCEAASGGTLFLDEIDAVPLPLQGKLLTAIERKHVRRLGAVAEHAVDIKLIAATNADLLQAVQHRQFRADLYHCLAVVVLTLPPLRERRDDLLVLAEAVLTQLAAAHGVPPKRLHSEAVPWLLQQDWPGNVRELGHLLERVTLLHPADTVDAATLAHWSAGGPEALPVLAASAPSPPPGPAMPAIPATDALPAEAQHIQAILVRTGGNLAQAARLLGLSRDQLRVRLRRYGLRRPVLTSAPPVLESSGVQTAPVAVEAHPVAASPPELLAAPPPVPGEWRPLTVLFCDLVDSTTLASELDLEVWQQVLEAYHAQCAATVARFQGYVAQYLGDGVLVYFGYPQAQEDDALRAVRAGLALVEAVRTVPLPAAHAPLQARVGLHTGRVVMGPIGTGAQREVLAVGEVPAIAARLQHLAAPDTVLISAATARLVAGYVVLDAWGPQTLPGVATPLGVAQVLGERAVANRLDATQAAGFTPLVGRAPELALLRARWAQVQEGQGQVVLLSGDAGIGKSRLVQVVRTEVVSDTTTLLLGQCAPELHHSPFAPLLALLSRRFSQLADQPAPLTSAGVAQALTALQLPVAELLPLFAALLSLPLPPDVPPLTLTPQEQKRRTLEALVRWLLHEAARHPVLLIVEDLHWLDPSSLEWLTLLIAHVPTVALYVLLTARPEFAMPWGAHAYLTSLTLARLPQDQTAALAQQVAHGKPLPPAVLERVVSHTDGVPLFIEELTKTLLESGLLTEQAAHYALTAPLPALTIPATLHAALMARLDRLGTAKTVAQLGATLGRQFPYILLEAVAEGEPQALRHDLGRLVEAEILYEQGLPPQASYLFKHALIQETAYQSLLKRARQRYHQHIAQVLEAQFVETTENHPELLAYHYSEAGLAAQAVSYWQRAGQQAAEHAAYAEAVAHFTQGLEILQTLPESPARHHQELALRLAMGGSLMAVKGMSAPDVHHMYTRAQALCQYVADPPQRAFALHGVWMFLLVIGAFQKAQEIAEQLLHLAHEQHDPRLLLGAHRALMATFHARGEMRLAYTHAQQGRALYNLEQHHTLGLQYGYDPGVLCASIGATSL